MVSGIILAAGSSSRFGSPKALVDFHGKKTIEHLQEELVSAGIHELVIVLGAHAEQIKPFLLKHKKIKFVHNKDYNLGQTSSVQTGFQAVSPEVQGVMVLPVDFPFVRKASLEELMNVFIKEQPLILVPTYQNKRGHPPIFCASLVREVLSLPSKVGLNTLNHAHQNETRFMAVEDEGVILTFNTPEELEKIRKSARPL